MKVRELEVGKKWNEVGCGCRGEVMVLVVVRGRSWESVVDSSQIWTSVST